MPKCGVGWVGGELVSNYSKVAGYKVNIHMSIVFYTLERNNGNLTIET